MLALCGSEEHLFREALQTSKRLFECGRVLRKGGSMASMYELFTAPASLILERWFESQILKATLATDAVIGSMLSPHDCGSAYVLLHHVMGR